MRALALLAVALGTCACVDRSVTLQPETMENAPAAQARAQLTALERESGGRLGVALRDPSGAVLLAYRGDERFATCSAFKTLLAARVLAGDTPLALDDRLDFSIADVEGHAPFTRSRAQQGWISVADAIEHIVTVSDNGATNLLLRSTGGPTALTAWVRTLGDDTIRLDRYELALNENAAGDPRDTSSPLAFGESYRVLANGTVLEPGARDRLLGWLQGATTGLKRLRAGLPADWRVGDKTGYCAAPGAVEINDVAVFSPDGRGWYTLVYFLDRPADAEQGDAIGVEVARIATDLIGARAPS